MKFCKSIFVITVFSLSSITHASPLINERTLNQNINKASQSTIIPSASKTLARRGARVNVNQGARNLRSNINSVRNPVINSVGVRKKNLMINNKRLRYYRTGVGAALVAGTYCYLENQGDGAINSNGLCCIGSNCSENYYAE